MFVCIPSVSWARVEFTKILTPKIASRTEQACKNNKNVLVNGRKHSFLM